MQTLDGEVFRDMQLMMALAEKFSGETPGSRGDGVRTKALMHMDNVLDTLLVKETQKAAYLDATEPGEPVSFESFKNFLASLER